MREWQADALRKLADFDDTILIAPPESGKESVVAMTAVRWVLYGGKVLWLTVKSGSGEWNKVKELKAIMEANPDLKLMIVLLRAKQGLCPYAKVWGKRHHKKVQDEVEFCNIARGAEKEPCPYQWKGFGEIRLVGVVDEEAAPQGVCPYFWLREAQKYADITICDLNYAISPVVRGAVMKLNPAFIDESTMLIVDEAHLLTPRAESAFRAVLPLKTVDRAISEVEGKFLLRRGRKLVGRFNELMGKHRLAAHYLQKIREAMVELRNRKKEEMRSELEEGSGEMKARITKDEFLSKDIEGGISYLERVGRVIARFKFINGIGARSWTLRVASFMRRFANQADAKWVCPYIMCREEECEVGLALLNPYNMVKYPLSRSCVRLFYSGTLYPEAFKRVYRLPADIRALSYPSPFPPESRLDIFVGGYRITRKWLESDENVKKLAGDIAEWLSGLSETVKCAAVTTMRIAERLKPHLERAGVSCKIFPSVPRKQRKSVVQRMLSEVGRLAVCVLRPHGWESHSHDMLGINVVLVIGVPISRLTVEKRAAIDYFQQTVGSGSAVAAFWWLAIVPAIQNAVQANARARLLKPSNRVVTAWLDERYLNPHYSGMVKKIGCRVNCAIAGSLKEATKLTRKYLTVSSGHK